MSEATEAQLRQEVSDLRRQLEVALRQRDAAIARCDSSAAILIGIHSLLYPPLIKLGDGRVFAFRPVSLNPHDLMQELSDRIRAVPEAIEKLSSHAAQPGADRHQSVMESYGGATQGG